MQKRAASEDHDIIKSRCIEIRSDLDNNTYPVERYAIENCVQDILHANARQEQRIAALEAELAAARARIGQWEARYEYLYEIIPLYVARDSAIENATIYGWFDDAETYCPVDGGQASPTEPTT